MNLLRTATGSLTLDGVALDDIANEWGTPTYVYSEAALTQAYRAYENAFASHKPLICYAMKANSNLGLLQRLVKLGAGFDIVSGGELARALAAGVAANKIVFSGVGKSASEIAEALAAGIHCFNVESEPELRRINEVAGTLGKVAPVSLRINPDVDAKTHPYISTGLKDNKFGIAYADALRIYRTAGAMPHLDVVGIDCHIGSQLTDIAPFVDALDRLLVLVDQLTAEGIALKHIDLGGGLGIRYADEVPPEVSAYADALLSRLQGRNLQLVLEPGRSLIGNAGLLLTRIEYLKHGDGKQFAIIDAAMNDLMRPALYEAWHDIVAVQQRDIQAHDYDVVGPVCESSDFLGKDRHLAVVEGDTLAVLSAGAYGMSMSSNYNTRPRAAEVLVGLDGQLHLLRRRESIAELLENEKALLG